MPFINGRYYMNPAYGRVLEHGRRRKTTPQLRTRKTPRMAIG
jgi:hypothetical protein